MKNIGKYIFDHSLEYILNVDKGLMNNKSVIILSDYSGLYYTNYVFEDEKSCIDYIYTTHVFPWKQVG